MLHAGQDGEQRGERRRFGNRRLDATMTTAQSNEAWYWSHPDWHAIRDIRQQVDDARLNERAEITPQAALKAAEITSLAASLIARLAAKVSAHLDAGRRRDTPGGLAMRILTRVAEDHAARPSGLDSLSTGAKSSLTREYLNPAPALTDPTAPP